MSISFPFCPRNYSDCVIENKGSTLSTVPKHTLFRHRRRTETAALLISSSYTWCKTFSSNETSFGLLSLEFLFRFIKECLGQIANKICPCIFCYLLLMFIQTFLDLRTTKTNQRHWIRDCIKLRRLFVTSLYLPQIWFRTELSNWAFLSLYLLTKPFKK